MLGAAAFVASFVKSPELLCIIPSEEVWIGLKEIIKSIKVIVLNMSVAANDWLASKPKSVLLAYGGSRFIGPYCIARHAVHVGCLIVLAGKRKIHAYIWLYLIRN